MDADGGHVLLVTREHLDGLRDHVRVPETHLVVVAAGHQVVEGFAQVEAVASLSTGFVLNGLINTYWYLTSYYR